MADSSAERGILSVEDCWQLLREQEFGRLAYVADGLPSIVPLNYAVDGEQLVFRTAEGTKLTSLLADAHVAFEVDQVDDENETGSSVVVRGEARLLALEEELRLEQVGLRPWLRGDKAIIVAIRPTEITGRCYNLRRPWRHMMRR